MKFCLAQKYAQNPEWVDLLNSTKDKIIIEDSTMQSGISSSYWGAKDLLKRHIISEKRSSLKAKKISKEEIDFELNRIY